MDIALHIAHTPTFLTELKIYSRFLLSQGIATPVFLLAYDQSYAGAFNEECKVNGIECRNAAEFAPKSKGLFSNFTGFGIYSPTKILSFAMYSLIAMIAGVYRQFIQETHLFNRSAAQVNEILQEINPTYLILGGDMPGYDSGLFIKESRKRGIKTFIIPSTMSNGKEQAEIYFPDSQYHAIKFSHKILAQIFKAWSKEYCGRLLFRVPLGRLLAIKFFGMDVDKPWVFNSTKADVIFLESKAMRDYYADVGLRSKNMIVTGSPTCDVLHQVRNDLNGIQTKLSLKYCLDDFEKVILIGLPPDFFYCTGGRPQSTYSNHAEVIEFFAD